MRAEMVCPNCATENRAGSRFCGGCGVPLSHVCAACGAANDPEMRFCNQCGSALGGAGASPAVPSASARAESLAERRLVSVLFADLVGFTTLSEARDAEEVREILSRYFESCKRLISLYGGTVEKFIGDAVMAVWGTPTAQ
jgi:predicted amidophosphoribosyltransferase